MDNRDEVLKRTRNALGHLEGVVKMIERDDYCVDVIRQIQAVQSSLNRVSTMVLEGHLQSCVTTAIRGKSPAERERVLKEITEVFSMSSRA
jgi:CsoR family transcriptional regulator, copper-sensing transcriptional repressor